MLNEKYWPWMFRTVNKIDSTRALNKKRCNLLRFIEKSVKIEERFFLIAESKFIYLSCAYKMEMFKYEDIQISINIQSNNFN